MKPNLIIAACLTAAMFSFSSYSVSEDALNAAKDLYTAGLMKGNSDHFSVEALELDRPATRTEIAITITRMLGKESKANYQQNPHPFTDVPDWASNHIGWLYENYLVNGVSETLFGSNDTATTRQFCTMLLRVLGYSDQNGDFSYDNAVEAALEIGLISYEEASRDILYRSDMAVICRRALNTPLKNAFRTLSEKLREDRAITKEQFDVLNPVQKNELDTFFEAYPESVANGIAYYDGSKYVIQMEEDIGDYGLRLFYTSDSNEIPTELPIDNAHYGFTKSLTASPFSWYKYVTVFNVYGLEEQTNAEFKVVNSSHEGVLYEIRGVSPTIKTTSYDSLNNYKVSLEDFFTEFPVKLSGGRISRNGNKVTVKFNKPVTYYGLRVVYTSDQTPFPKELPIENKSFGFTKGAPDWNINGKIHEVTLNGISDETGIRVCVAETSSEGNIYNTYGISPVIEE